MCSMNVFPDERVQPELADAIEIPCVRMPSSALQSRNVRIHKRRTSVRLEPAMWNALNEIAMLERCSIHDLCGAVYDVKQPDLSFTAALRVFMMEYYRASKQADGPVSMIKQKLKAKKDPIAP